MDSPEIVRRFGPEYPAAILVQGVRIPLHSESRFRRVYKNDQAQHYFSRFMDHSATMTFEELSREWPQWDERLRQEFCSECNWLAGQEDFPAMLRLIIKSGHASEWSAIALSIASEIPQAEAFEFLSRALANVPADDSANFSQAVAKTRHPQAAEVIRKHLESLWSHPRLWDQDKFQNFVAFAAICSIQHLLELGERSAQFEEKVKALAMHQCAGSRRSCQNFLKKYFPWLDSSAEG